MMLLLTRKPGTDILRVNHTLLRHFKGYLFFPSLFISMISISNKRMQLRENTGNGKRKTGSGKSNPSVVPPNNRVLKAQAEGEIALIVLPAGESNASSTLFIQRTKVPSNGKQFSSGQQSCAR